MQTMFQVRLLAAGFFVFMHLQGSVAAARGQSQYDIETDVSKIYNGGHSSSGSRYGSGDSPYSNSASGSRTDKGYSLQYSGGGGRQSGARNSEDTEYGSRSGSRYSQSGDSGYSSYSGSSMSSSGGQRQRGSEYRQFDGHREIRYGVQPTDSDGTKSASGEDSAAADNEERMNRRRRRRRKYRKDGGQTINGGVGGHHGRGKLPASALPDYLDTQQIQVEGILLCIESLQ